MTRLRVLVLEESIGDDGLKVWVAQALEQDMATQVAIGEPALSAVAALGVMFDTHDAFATSDAAEGADVAPLPVTPDWYHRAWTRGTPLGEHPLGVTRLAEVRAWTA